MTEPNMRISNYSASHGIRLAEKVSVEIRSENLIIKYQIWKRSDDISDWMGDLPQLTFLNHIFRTEKKLDDIQDWAYW